MKKFVNFSLKIKVSIFLFLHSNSEFSRERVNADELKLFDDFNLENGMNWLTTSSTMCDGGEQVFDFFFGSASLKISRNCY